MHKSMMLRIASMGLVLAVASSACIALGALEEPPTPSGQITAIPVQPTEAAPTEAPASAPVQEPSAEPTTAGVAEEAPATEDQPESSGAVIFQISQDESEARFLIDEVLRGEPTTAVGVTNQVVGEIAVDFADPASAQVGIIQINARTLATDQDRRNNAIQNRILFTGEHEFITFEPTAVNGLPATIAFGEAVPIQITGDVTIVGVTNTVTFEGQVTAVSESRLEGSAAAVVQRADYGLQIPSVPFVADVGEDVRLEIDFVALAG